MPTLIAFPSRQYTSRAQVITGYKQGHDFILSDPTSRWDGKPCSCRDFPLQQVSLRYAFNRKVALTTYYPPEHTS